MNELALFAGAGGGLLATHHLLGWRCVGYVEMAEYPCKVLEARINDGLLSRAPIFQMHTGDFIELGLAEKYRGVADVVTAGFPCQPFSRAGLQLADKDPRNGWPDTITIIRQVRPRYVLLENVSRLVSSPYFGTILGDLAASGYGYRWDCIPASAVGANHQRDRLWIVGWNVADAEGERRERPGVARYGRDGFKNGSTDVPNPNGYGLGQRSNEYIRSPQRETKTNVGDDGEKETMANSNGKQELEPRNHHQAIVSQGNARLEFSRRSSGRLTGIAGGTMADTNGRQLEEQRQPITGETPHLARYNGWWEVEPNVGRVVNELAHRVDRLKAIGNGQVPAVVKEVWELMQ